MAAGMGRVEKIAGTPHDKRRGTLRNANPPGDFSAAARCGARTRGGTSCQCPAMKNGRCKLHGSWLALKARRKLSMETIARINDSGPRLS